MFVKSIINSFYRVFAHKMLYLKGRILAPFRSKKIIAVKHSIIVLIKTTGRVRKNL